VGVTLVRHTQIYSPNFSECYYVTTYLLMRVLCSQVFFHELQPTRNTQIILGVRL